MPEFSNEDGSLHLRFESDDFYPDSWKEKRFSGEELEVMLYRFRGPKFSVTTVPRPLIKEPEPITIPEEWHESSV